LKKKTIAGKFLRLLEKGELTKDDLKESLEKQQLEYEEGDSDFDEDEEDSEGGTDDAEKVQKKLGNLSVSFKDEEGGEEGEEDEEDEEDGEDDDLDSEDDYENEYEEELDEEEAIVYGSVARK